MLKRVLNRPEEQTYFLLRAGCERWGANVFAKVRVADVLELDGSGLIAADYSFALRSHFDFLITEGGFSPLFAVEFDGPLHKTEQQVARDQRKNRLCERFELPLLRVKSRYLERKYRDWDLVSWFVEYWFLERAFNKAQEQGSIPWDEGFDTMSVWDLPERKGAFPLALAYDAHWKVRRLADRGKCWSPGLSHIVSCDKQGVYHALGYVIIDSESCALAELKMSEQQFSVCPSELLGDLVGLETYEALRDALRNPGRRRPLAELNHKILRYERELDLRGATCCSRGNPCNPRMVV